MYIQFNKEFFYESRNFIYSFSEFLIVHLDLWRRENTNVGTSRTQTRIENSREFAAVFFFPLAHRKTRGAGGKEWREEWKSRNLIHNSNHDFKFPRGLIVMLDLATKSMAQVRRH